ncbi:radical SAM protein [Agrobacterium pusense]|uniref:radical SAM protein n=1 Tax=Agrobacterium pusense TaxID=648995 RepID=UPI0035A6B041
MLEREKLDILAQRTLQKLLRDNVLSASAIELVLNDACNLACSYCFETVKTAKRQMPYHIGKAAVDHMLGKPHQDRKEIFFFGGEPFLAWKVMRDLIAYARSLEPDNVRLGLSVTTNATYVPPDAPEILKGQDVGVLVSLDPGKVAHDTERRFRDGRPSFSLARGNAIRLLSAGVYTSVRITVMPKYVGDLYEFVCECVDVGFREIVIGAALPGEWNDESISDFAQVASQVGLLERSLRSQNADTQIRLFDDYKNPVKSCSAGTSLLAISPEGEVYGCSRLLMANKGKGTQKIGDILSFHADKTAQEQISEGTRLSGCAAVNFDENGNVAIRSNTLVKLDNALRAVAQDFFV